MSDSILIRDFQSSGSKPPFRVSKVVELPKLYSSRSVLDLDSRSSSPETVSTPASKTARPPFVVPFHYRQPPRPASAALYQSPASTRPSSVVSEPNAPFLVPLHMTLTGSTDHSTGRGSGTESHAPPSSFRATKGITPKRSQSLSIKSQTKTPATAPSRGRFSTPSRKAQTLSGKRSIPSIPKFEDKAQIEDKPTTPVETPTASQPKPLKLPVEKALPTIPPKVIIRAESTPPKPPTPTPIPRSNPFRRWQTAEPEVKPTLPTTISEQNLPKKEQDTPKTTISRSSSITIVEKISSPPPKPEPIIETQLVQSIFGVRKIRKVIVPPLEEGAVPSQDLRIQKEIESLRTQKKVQGVGAAEAAAMSQGMYGSSTL